MDQKVLDGIESAIGNYTERRKSQTGSLHHQLGLLDEIKESEHFLYECNQGILPECTVSDVYKLIKNVTIRLHSQDRILQDKEIKKVIQEVLKIPLTQYYLQIGKKAFAPIPHGLEKKPFTDPIIFWCRFYPGMMDNTDGVYLSRKNVGLEGEGIFRLIYMIRDQKFVEEENYEIDKYRYGDGNDRPIKEFFYEIFRKTK